MTLKWLPRYILVVDELFGISAGIQVYIYPLYPHGPAWPLLIKKIIRLTGRAETEAQTGAQNLPVDPTRNLVKLPTQPQLSLLSPSKSPVL